MTTESINLKFKEYLHNNCITLKGFAKKAKINFRTVQRVFYNQPIKIKSMKTIMRATKGSLTENDLVRDWGGMGK